MLSWLRLARRQASVKSLASEPQGLDAFSSEERPAATSTPENASPKNLQFAVGFLILLVALQAYPSALWVRNSLRKSTEPTTPPARTDVPPALSAAAIPAGTTGCEAPPVSAAPADRSNASAAPQAAPAAAPAAAASPQLLAGMLSVSAPVPLRLFERGRLVGTTEAESTMLPQGTHQLEFVNEAVGLHVRRTVVIRPGSTSSVTLDAPPGTLHINAVPWAEVWIDGERVGDTPIGNLQVKIGSREIVFRHPDLGERRTTAMVTLKEPIRISMDLRKK